MRVQCGWMYREKGSGVTPDRIRVEVTGNVRVFDDNQRGAQDAADFVTSRIGNDWKLEEMGFLGYRIIVDDKTQDGEGPFIGKVTRKSSTGEWVARVYNKHRRMVGEYFTDDKQDADDTLKAMLQERNGD